MAAGKVVGLETVMRNLNAQIAQIKGDVLAGLMEAGLQVQRAAQQRVPVQTGNLKASAYTRKDPSGRPQVQVGFSASYALWVHENVEMKLKGLPRARRGYKGSQGRYWDPQGKAGPKFLQNAVNDNRGNILQIVQRRARVRPLKGGGA
jgi:hypothetical protein